MGSSVKRDIDTDTTSDSGARLALMVSSSGSKGWCRVLRPREGGDKKLGGHRKS